MTVDLSTKRQASVWDKTVHALAVKRDLIRKYDLEASAIEKVLRENFDHGIFELPTYFLGISEDHVIITPKENS